MTNPDDQPCAGAAAVPPAPAKEPHMSRSAAVATSSKTAVQLRLVPAPQPRLPYDDERAEGAPRHLAAVPGRPAGQPDGSPASIQGTLALAFPLPSGVPAVPMP